MQIPPDGKTIYAGATLDDGSYVVISTPANPVGAATFSVVAKTVKQPNGVACDWSKNMLYYTMEGSATLDGALMGVDLNTGVESTVYGGIDGADGAWFDASTSLLYVGLLTELKVLVFNTSVAAGADGFLVGEYPALSLALHKGHMMDDLTLFDASTSPSSSPAAMVQKEQQPLPGAATVMLGADWLGCQLQKFNLAGTAVTAIPPPAGVESFYQVTSVRWGRGPGFDPQSVYVTEGGGLLPTQTDRRVIQIKMGE